MIWLFERGDRVARVVTRYDAEHAAYILEIEWSDGAQTAERFLQAESFKARLLELEQQFMTEEWIQSTDSPRPIAPASWKP